jgi:hypothetical protein
MKSLTYHTHATGKESINETRIGKRFEHRGWTNIGLHGLLWRQMGGLSCMNCCMNKA